MHMHNNLHKLSKHFQSPARNFTNTGSDPLVNEKANAKKFSAKNSKTKGRKKTPRVRRGGKKVTIINLNSRSVKINKKPKNHRYTRGLYLNLYFTYSISTTYISTMQDFNIKSKPP